MDDFNFRGAINRELAAKYTGWNWGEIEERVCNDAATAARTATHLRNLAAQMEGVLNAEQRLALQAAASVAGGLAGDLKELKPWAKAYKAHRLATQAADHERRLDEAAAKRWASDEGAVQEAEDLLDWSSDSGDAVAFVIARHPGHDRAYLKSCDLDVGNALRELPSALAARDSLRIRRLAIVAALEFSGARPHSDGRTWFGGGEDYAAWRTARATARATTAHTLATLAAPR